MVLHYVVHVSQHPQGVLAGIPALGHDGLEAVHRIEGVGIPGNEDSISSSKLSAAGMARRRAWMVRAVSTKDLLILSRPLATHTF
ncbi:MAG: hypothetical protein ACKPKO_54140, partial [Candidatus Fonsibacter sp.]